MNKPRYALLDAEEIHHLLKAQSTALAELERLGEEIGLAFDRMREHASGFAHKPDCCEVCQRAQDEVDVDAVLERELLP